MLSQKKQDDVVYEDGDLTSIRSVLVVDDSRFERRILAGSLRKWGYHVMEAENAQVALDLCKVSPPDLVLSDWMMPGMSGPEFCCAFRQLSLERYGYFILLTSKSDATEVAHGLNAGADDFLTKPVNSDELKARISAGDRILRMERQLSDKNQVISETLAKLQDVYDKIDADLLQARKIQQSLVPRFEETFGNSKVNLLLKPCGHIGGDLVGMFSPGANRLGFFSIDVSGHGITSALMTARLGSYLNHSHLEQNVAMERRFDKFYSLKQPEEVARHLNARLDADTGIEEYFTMAYGIADLSTGNVRMVQAGHPHPLLIKQDGRMEFVGKGGMPIGLIPDVDFEQIEFSMEPGDRLLLYSDGFSEALVEGGEMLGEDGLMEMAKTVADRPGREFLDDLFWTLTQRMTSEDGMDDDVSATLFEFAPNGI